MLSRFVTLSLIAAFLMPSANLWRRSARAHRPHTSIQQDQHIRMPEPDGYPLCAVRPATELWKTVRAGRTTSERSDDTAPELVDPIAPPQLSFDPGDDDDQRLKKGRRKGSRDATVTALREPPRFVPVEGFLVRLRVYLMPDRPDRPDETVALPHFGSGPCHSIPRPREGTIDTSHPQASLTV